MPKKDKDRFWHGGAFKPAGRYESNLTAVDPLTGEIKKTVHLPIRTTAARW